MFHELFMAIMCLMCKELPCDEHIHIMLLMLDNVIAYWYGILHKLSLRTLHKLY
jgi:hypothetical protein